MTTLPSSRRRFCKTKISWICFVLITAALYSFLLTICDLNINVPAWRPRPRGSRSISKAFKFQKKCPDWTSISKDELKLHTTRGGVNQNNINEALTHPLLIHRVFHLAVRNGDLYVAKSPLNCQETTVCWRRAMFLLQQIDDILAGSVLQREKQKQQKQQGWRVENKVEMNVENSVRDEIKNNDALWSDAVELDILYWPWDEPMHDSSSYPIWQYNRYWNVTKRNQKKSPGILIPYSYAFSYEELKSLQQKEQSIKERSIAFSNTIIDDARNVRGKEKRIGKGISKENENDSVSKIETTKKTEKRVVFRGGMTFPTSQSWKLSTRGMFCLVLDKHPEMKEWIDFGIVDDGWWYKKQEWQNPKYGCGQGKVTRISMEEQASTYGLFLDIEGQSGFTDRLPKLLALNATILQQSRRIHYADFLSSHIHPGIHTIPIKHDLSNLIEVVQAARADPIYMQNVSDAAAALVDNLLTDHSCLCAIRSNMETQLLLQKMGKDSADNVQIVSIEQRVTSHGKAIVWERIQNSGYLLSLVTRESVQWVRFGIGSILLMVVAKLEKYRREKEYKTLHKNY